MMLPANEVQRKVQAKLRAFAQNEIGQDLISRDAEGAKEDRSWRNDWQKCADVGVFNLNLPREFGGDEFDISTTVLGLESLGYGCPDNGLAIGINGQIWTVQLPLVEFGSSAQKEKYLRGLGNGSFIGVQALTEAESGSDAMNLKTSAVRQGEGYLLNGTKIYVGLGPACDVALVFANTNPEHGKWGITAFLVEKDDAGFERGEVVSKMGMRTIPMGSLHFKNCWVPKDRILGNEGSGLSLIQKSMDIERCFILSCHVGSLQRQLEVCIKFAKERHTFGKPIMEHQSVANRIADMRLRLETSRLMLYQAALKKDAGQGTLLDAALVKLHISESFLASSMDAVRIHGGAGYLQELEVERDLRDSVGDVILAGTSDIQRQIIANML